MKNQKAFHEFELPFPDPTGWLPRQGRIGARLWQTIAPGTPFDPADERLRDLSWAYAFARCRLIWTQAHPDGLIFRVCYDVPTVPNQFRVLAQVTRLPLAAEFSLFGRGRGAHQVSSICG
jgi:hypothetical protein